MLNLGDYRKYLDLLTNLSNVGDVSEEQFNSFCESQSNNNFVLVKIYDDRIVSCVSAIIEQKMLHSFSKVMHIEDVVTHPDYRGKGFSSELILDLLDISVKIKCYKVILNCKKEMVNFYKHLGMIQEDYAMVKRNRI